MYFNLASSVDLGGDLWGTTPLRLDGEGIAAGEVRVSRLYEHFLDGTSGFNMYVVPEGDR